MICRICNNFIEPERLEILPNTVACAGCANKHNLGTPRLGRMVFDHKTGGTLQIMSQETFNNTRQYYEPNGARSVIKNFSKNICD
jgi:RNA polymerase-binding transcription factor DksA